MTTPMERAISKMADTLGQHRRVPRGEGQPFSTCSNRRCFGIVFLNRRDHHEHQAIMSAEALKDALGFALEVVADDAAERGEQPSPVELAEIRAEFLVLAEAHSPDTDARLVAARALALEDAATEARTRGDVGKDGCVNAWDFLDQQAEKARRTAARLDVVAPNDRRVAQAAVAVRAALAAADRAAQP